MRPGFFSTLRSLGLATATTSAAFFPHLEHLIRRLERYPPADQASECLRLNFTGHAVLTDDAHEEITKLVVQFLYVVEHPHKANGAERW